MFGNVKSINKTAIIPNKETIDVLKEFILKYINFTIPKDTKYEDLSVIQDAIRKNLKPFIKKKINYLKYYTLKYQDFYALFVLIIVIDDIKIFSDNWKHINQITKVNYNPQDRISTNEFNFSLLDNYFSPEDINDPTMEVNCCCGQVHLSACNSSKMFNARHTFIIGSYCIYKTSIEYHKTKMSNVRKNKKIKQAEDEFRAQGGRWCLDCPRKLPLHFETWKIRCLQCHISYINS